MTREQVRRCGGDGGAVAAPHLLCSTMVASVVIATPKASDRGGCASTSRCPPMQMEHGGRTEPWNLGAHAMASSTNTPEAVSFRKKTDQFLRGGRDLKVPRPDGQEGTAPDSGGQSAKNRGPAAADEGLEWTGADPESQSVSAAVAPDRRSAPPCYCNGMSTLHARVKGGQIVVEGKTDLPEGTELTLVMVEADDEMTPEERADLEAELERGRAAIAAGRGISGDELLARVRES